MNKSEKVLQHEDERRQVEIAITMEIDGKSREESDKLLKMLGFGDQAALRKADKKKMKQWAVEYDKFLLSRQNL